MRWLLPVLMLGLMPAVAQPALVLCTEGTDGCIATLVGPDPAIAVASDGENPFRPCGIQVDVSDAIQFVEGAFWALDPSSLGWVQFNANVWYLPANLDSIGCGIENETTCEPRGKWIFTPGTAWNAGTEAIQVMLDPDGTVGDAFFLLNDGPNGGATISFFSDPNVPPIPGPATLILVGLGLGFAAVATRLRRKAA